MAAKTGTCMVCGVAMLRNRRIRLPGLGGLPARRMAINFPCLPGALQGLAAVLGRLPRACPVPSHGILITAFLQYFGSPCI